MHSFYHVTALSLLLPALISASCAPCDSYMNGLKACQTTSSNVTAVGTASDKTTVHCMCSDKTNGQDMNGCYACAISATDTELNEDLDTSVLLAWQTTCTADTQFGEDQAVLCWQGQPLNPLPCFTKSNQKGSAPAGMATSAATTASAPSATASAAKSNDATTGVNQVSKVLPIVVVGLGLILAT